MSESRYGGSSLHSFYIYHFVQLYMPAFMVKPNLNWC